MNKRLRQSPTFSAADMLRACTWYNESLHVPAEFAQPIVDEFHRLLEIEDAVRALVSGDSEQITALKQMVGKVETAADLPERMMG